MSAAEMTEPAAPCASCGERDWRENIGWSPERPCPACGALNGTLKQRRELDPWYLREPEIHSQVTDVLPEEDPRAWTSIDCSKCGQMVHAFNNENMQTWVDTRVGPYCLRCFATVDDGPEDPPWF